MKRREGGRKSGRDDFSRRPFEGRAPPTSRASSFNSPWRGGGQRGNARKGGKEKKGRIVNDDLVARSFLLERWTRTVEKLYHRRVFRFSRPIDPIDF